VKVLEGESFGVKVLEDESFGMKVFNRAW